MPFSNVCRLHCKCIFSRLLAVVLSLLIAFPTPVLAEDSAASNLLSDAIEKNTEKNRLQDTKLDLMLKLAARANMSLEDRKKADEEEKKKLEAAKERLENPPEKFDTPLGTKTRDKLKEIVNNTPILGADSTKVDVEKAQAQMAKAAAIAAIARKEAIEEYHTALQELPKELINALAEPLVTAEKLASDPKLDEMLAFLDPSLSLDSMSAAEKANYIIQNFTNRGVMSSELIAAYHRTDRLVGLLKENGHEITAEVEKIVEKVGSAAEQAVDVHRAGADYAEFSTQMMTMAMMTGNPYVMAAAVAIILLLAILDMLFGGGGGDGDGPGDGKGEGSSGRNKNAANGDQNPSGADVTTKDPRPGGEGKGNPDGDLPRVVDMEPSEVDRTSFRDFGSSEGPYAYTVDANDVFTFYPNDEQHKKDTSLDVKFDPRTVDIDPTKITKLVSVGGSPKACVAELVVSGSTVIAYSKDQGESWFVPPTRTDRTQSTRYVVDGTNLTLFPDGSEPFSIDLSKVDGAEGVSLHEKLKNIAPAFSSAKVRLRLGGVDVELERSGDKWTATEKGIAEE